MRAGNNKIVFKENKVKEIIRQFNREKAYTIVELLTVMSIIIILIGLFAPAVVQVRRFARDVKQRNQFKGIREGLELFTAEMDGYPPSEGTDGIGTPYCGAMKLAEAMMGQDLLGFHPSSIFRADGTIDGTPATQLYDLPLPPTDPLYKANLKARKGPYLQSDDAYRMGNIFPASHLGPFLAGSLVLCDVYGHVTNLGSEGDARIGMPVLYYKADTSKTLHDPNNPGNPDNIYDYMDNHTLVSLGMPWEAAPPAGPRHALFDDGSGIPGRRFYINTRDDKITTTWRPYKYDSYILLSAGNDGEYGTADDIFNFEWRYKEY